MVLFSKIIAALRGEQADLEASEKLAEVCAAVRKTGKPGTLTISLTIKPGGDGRVFITDNSKTSKPELPRRDSLFFVTEAGDLSRTDPYQSRLELAREED